MSSTADQLDSWGGITNSVFCFWWEPTWGEILEILQFETATIRICLFYSNIHYCFFAVSFIKLLFFEMDCEELTFQFSLLSCTVGSALHNRKLWIKSFQQATDTSWHSLVHLLAAKLNWFSKCYYITVFNLNFNQFFISISTNNQILNP